MAQTKALKKIPTGIEGLDDVLGGGLPDSRIFLIEGNPGSGKTTVALQFLLDGAKKGEPCVYVTLSETTEELRQVAESHGWSLDNVHLMELRQPGGDKVASADEQYTFFHPSEVELGETTQKLLERIEAVNPKRVVFDSLSELRLLAREPLRFRRQVLALKQYFIGRGVTVLLLDDKTAGPEDLQLQSIAHGVLELEQLAPEYGAERRRLRIMKIRGASYRGGYHDFKLGFGGITVFPRLVAAEHLDPFPEACLPSGSPALDQMFGGGLSRGSSTLIMGPAGVGKSSLATLFAATAMGRGENVTIFTFDESLRTVLSRSQRIKAPLASHLEENRLQLEHVDPAELSPGEFIQKIRDAVEKRNARVVVIDSLNGYLNAMPEERFLLVQMHELLSYLGQKGVVTFLIVGQQGGMDGRGGNPVDISYLADNAVYLRFFERKGQIRRAISVVKIRDGEPDNTIRPMGLSPKGIDVGEPIENYSGILCSPGEQAGRLDG